MPCHVSPEAAAYLERIGYTGSTEPGIEALAELQEKHLHAIPYENLDILNRKPLSLEIPDLFTKIVTNRRGGYCFELNALFSWLLRELGYSVTDLMARFWRDEPSPPPKRRHHVLKVELGDVSYLCDVGVGGAVPIRPLRMEELLVQQQGEEIYRIEKDAGFGWVLSEFKREQWTWVYSFTEEPQLAKDYIMASYWCENAPESIFVQQKMAAIRTAEGRHTIAGEQFRIFTAEGVHSFIPETDAAYKEALWTYFGIRLD